MRLSELLAALPEELAVLETASKDQTGDPTIRGIRYDSRQVAPGDLFVAVRGANSDGHRFIGRAVASGAAALLVEEMPSDSIRGEVPTFRVADCRRALAPLGEQFFGRPADDLTLIGVTGTNGKTSTTYLVESILTHAGQRTGLVGTVEIRYAGEREVAVNTTPESLDLQRTLRAMRNAQVDAAVMEVSSHGLELGRVGGCRFRIAAFTNLSQDHLDFHGSMDAYLASKTRLFRDHLAPGATAVINIDDPAAEKSSTPRAAGEPRSCGSAEAPTALRNFDSYRAISSSRERVPFSRMTEAESTSNYPCLVISISRTCS